MVKKIIMIDHQIIILLCMAYPVSFTHNEITKKIFNIHMPILRERKKNVVFTVFIPLQIT